MSIFVNIYAAVSKHLSIYAPVSIFVNISMLLCLSIYLYIYAPGSCVFILICLYSCVYICKYLCFCGYISIYLCSSVSIFVNISMLLCLSIYLYIYAPVSLSVFTLGSIFVSANHCRTHQKLSWECWLGLQGTLPHQGVSPNMRGNRVLCCNSI